MRVNMDSSVISDPRFKLLGKRLGITWREVIGSCFLVWTACYERRSELMSHDEIDTAAEIEAFASGMVSVGLAHNEASSGLVLVHGVFSRIDFLQKQKAKGSKGGKQSGKSRGGKGVTDEANAQAEPEAYASAPAQAYSPAPAPAPAPGFPPTEENHSVAAQRPVSTPTDDSSPTEKPKKPRKEPDSVHHRFIQAFSDAWFTRYGSQYPFAGGKDGSAINWFRSQVSSDLDRFRAIVRNYLDDATEFVVEARHSIGLLRSQWVRWSVKALPIAGKNSNVMDQFKAAAGEFLNGGDYHDAN